MFDARLCETGISLSESGNADVNRLVAVLDEQYYYDEDGYLRAGKISEASYEITV